MHFIKSGNKEFIINFDDLAAASGQLNGASFIIDFIKQGKNSFHAIYKKKSFIIHVLDIDLEKNTFSLRVNGSEYLYSLETKHDRLLKDLGMADTMVQKIAGIKAPMPGLILDIKVKNSQQVSKGETLLVLEAMKMENILKSPIDGIIKNILVKNGETVEKNEILINFE